jgi:uroporphyrinogen-III synthase
LDIYLLGDERFDGVINIAVSRIEFLSPEFEPKDYDGIVFTSKNAVRGIDRLWGGWRDVPSYSIGQGTSAEITRLGGHAAFTAARAYGDAFAEEIAPQLSGKSVLFPRARDVVSDVALLLRAEGVLVHELIVYQNGALDELPELSDEAIFIFTAPSSVTRFLHLAKWRDTYTAVAIGAKTAAAFPDTIIPHIAPLQSVASCVQYAQKIKQKSL